MRSARWLCGFRSHTLFVAEPCQRQAIGVELEPVPGLWVLIDEKEMSINHGWFAVEMVSFDPPRPSADYIADCPANYHNKAGGLNFADGHAEIHKWTDPQIVKESATLSMSSPNSRDVQWLMERSSSKAVNPTVNN